VNRKGLGAQTKKSRDFGRPPGRAKENTLETFGPNSRCGSKASLPEPLPIFCSILTTPAASPSIRSKVAHRNRNGARLWGFQVIGHQYGIFVGLPMRRQGRSLRWSSQPWMRFEPSREGSRPGLNINWQRGRTASTVLRCACGFWACPAINTSLARPAAPPAPHRS
jgi:hypothetical protein